MLKSKTQQLKPFIIGAFVLSIIIVFSFLVTIKRIDQNEIGFKYDLDGSLINRDNNPPLSFGWAATFGHDAKIFVINSEVTSFNFTSKHSEDSPYADSLSWDSREGVTMQGDFTIFGKVTDPWKFYGNYGRVQGSYRKMQDIEDKRIYEALRHAGHFVDARMGELAESEDADNIRKNPQKYASILKEEAANYTDQFGFTVTNIIFPAAFEFPGGNTIKVARQKLMDANSRLQDKKELLVQARLRKDQTIGQAKIDAKPIVEEGQQLANRLTIEGEALASEMEILVKTVGVEGAMKLKTAELQSILIKKGVVNSAVVTEDSLFGKAFYPSKK